MKNVAASLSPVVGVLLLGLFSLFVSCGKNPPPAAPSGSPGKKLAVDFVNDVKPILQTQCVRCHNDENLLGGLNLMTKESAGRGSKRGPILVPGEPDKSPLYRVTILPDDAAHAMPATGPKLTDEEKAILRQWIEDGAQWPDGKDGGMAPVKPTVNRV